jgi:hypothetical protein
MHIHVKSFEISSSLQRRIFEGRRAVYKATASCLSHSILSVSIFLAYTCPSTKMKFSVALLSLISLVSAAAIPVSTDVRGTAADKAELGSDEFNDWGFTVRGNVPDVTNLQTDIVPESTVSVREFNAELGKRETLVEITDRLLFDVGLSTFLYYKSITEPDELIWADDGCSNAPDTPAGYNFLHACMRHDCMSFLPPSSDVVLLVRKVGC